MLKKVLVTGISVLSLSLAGCGVSSEEELSNAYQGLIDAKSYERETTLTFDVDTKVNTDLQQSLSYLEDVQMTSEVRTDKKIFERDYRIQTESDEVEMLWITETSPTQNKTYLRTEDYYGSFNELAEKGDLPNKYEMPTEFKNTLLLITSGEANEVEQVGVTKDKLSGVTISEKKDELQLLFTEDSDKMGFLEMINMELNFLAMTETDGKLPYLLDLVRKGNVEVGDVNYVVALEDGQLKEESYVLPLHFIENGVKVASIDLTVEVDHENIDQPTQFNYDWEKAKIVSMEEVMEDILQQTK